MNAAEYEIEAAKFTDAGRTYRHAKREFDTIRAKRDPSDVEKAVWDAAELAFMRAQRAHDAAYAMHSKASPDTSEEKIVKDAAGKESRVKLTSAEITTRDKAQAVAEVDYWPAMKDTPEDQTKALTPAEVEVQSAALTEFKSKLPKGELP